jgi:hypothetical protein
MTSCEDLIEKLQSFLDKRRKTDYRYMHSLVGKLFVVK